MNKLRCELTKASSSVELNLTQSKLFLKDTNPQCSSASIKAFKVVLCNLSHTYYSICNTGRGEFWLAILHSKLVSFLFFIFFFRNAKVILKEWAPFIFYGPQVIFLSLISKNFYFHASNYTYFGKFILSDSKFKLSNS